MKILLPVDGSEPSLDAVRHAADLVRNGLDASFVLLNVQEPASLYEMVVAPDARALRQVHGEAGMHALQDAEDLLGQLEIGYDKEVVSGDAVGMIIEACERHGCDAIHLGAHGHGLLRSALLGSVTHGVLQSAPVPVTIVRPLPRELQESTE